MRKEESFQMIPVLTKLEISDFVLHLQQLECW